MNDRIPAISDLLMRHLDQEASAQIQGIQPVAASEVEAYDAVPGQRIDAQLGWSEAKVALRELGHSSEIAPPGDWSSLVAMAESQFALPLAAGHYPQAVRDLLPLYRADSPAALDSKPIRGQNFPGLVEFASQAGDRWGQFLIGVGALRLAGQCGKAAELLEARREDIPAEWQAMVANEWAATMWMSGRRAEAAAKWQELPESVPVLFNRGLAALFLGQPEQARAALSEVVAKLPESSGWHHLARLYLTLAQV